MKISHKWLQDYFDETLPPAEELGRLLTMHAFEVESIEKVGDDSVLDIKVLPDRSHDSLSHRGIAQEVSVLTKIALKPGVLTLQGIHVPESNVLKAEILDTKLCKRISLLVMEGVEVKESPIWLQERLEAIGQKSINNIVDATNYVMFALGQPLHAYDRNLLSEAGGEWKIIAKRALEGERVLALDNKEYILNTSELVIADGNNDRVLGIAGIKGGKASEITSQTTDIVLEAANFEPINIRKTAKKLGLRTDASVRFENEITPELTLAALKQVSDLIYKIAGTEKTKIEGMVDIYPRPAHPYKIGVSLSEIQSVLGIDISKKEVEEIFTRRNFEWRDVDPRKEIVSIAEKNIGKPYKFGASVVFDAPNFFDCGSFLAYVFAQSGLAIPRVSIDQYAFSESVEKSDLVPGDLLFMNTHVEKHTRGSYYSHVLGKDVEQVAIRTETLEFKPGTKIPEGIDHVAIYVGNDEYIHASGKKGTESVERKLFSEICKEENLRGFRRVRGVEESRYVVTAPAERIDLRLKEDVIEEIGKVYGYKDLQAKNIQPLSHTPEIEKKTYYANMIRDVFVMEGFSEVITYVFRKTGDVELENPIASDKSFLRKNLSDGLSEAVTLNIRNIDLLGLTEIKIFEIGNVFTNDGEHTAVSFAGGKKTATEAVLSEKLGESLLFTETDKVFELNLDKLLTKLPAPERVLPPIEHSEARFKAFSVYPSIVRDIAVFVPEGEHFEEIIKLIQKEAKELLVTYRLFDAFTKEFPEGKKTSYAYRLVFQSKDRTLTDAEINPIVEAVTNALNAKQGWQVR
jgi:phenylalanyl-tRNA synthetase beta subunit